MRLNLFVLVGLGGFVGAISRQFIMTSLKSMRIKDLPLSLLVINISGSMALGALLGAGLENEWILLLLGTGLLGAFTTFSTFKVEGYKVYKKAGIRSFVLYNLICYGAAVGTASGCFIVSSYVCQHLFS